MWLRHQDRARWNHAEIAAAADLVVRAAQLRRPGPYQIQAAIVACHAEAPSWDATDWPQILLLYDALVCHLPSPVTRLHRAIALGQMLGPQAALDATDALAADLDRYHLYHATRAEGRLADEIVPVSNGKAMVDQDECIRADASAEGLAGCSPLASVSSIPELAAWLAANA